VSGLYLVKNGISVFACSETQKFGHVTFFWNGNRSGYFDNKLETYLEVGGWVYDQSSRHVFGEARHGIVGLPHGICKRVRGRQPSARSWVNSQG
jgi:hypothetical protein